MKSKKQLLDLGEVKGVQFNRTQVYKELKELAPQYDRKRKGGAV